MFAKPGQQIGYLAVGGDTPQFGLLGDSPTRQWSRLKKSLSALWRTASEEEKARLIRISGCLDKLRTSLLQCHRLRQHHDQLFEDAAQQLPPGSAAYSGDIACADFEGLLLQGRAALDRLTWFVTSEFGNPPSSSFRKLRNVLANFKDTREEAAHRTRNQSLSGQGSRVDTRW